MPDGLPCPNPTCTHTFPPDTVKGAAALNCPKCGHVFKFARQPAVKPPARPAAKPALPPPPPPKAPPPPPPRPAPAVPIAAPIAAPPAAPINPAFAFPTDDEPVHTRLKDRKRSGGGWWGVIVVGLIVFGLGGAVVGGLAYYHYNVEPLFGRDDPRKDRVQANFSFKTTWSWKPDDRARRLLEARVALTRSNPRAHMALAFEDYRTRQPSDDELLDEAVRRLKAFFPRLEYIDPIQAGKGKAGDLDEEPAWKLEFRATGSDEVPMVGECLFLARRGFGYWWMTWGPQADEEDLPETWEKLREGFKFHNEREGWQPTPRPTTTVKLDKIPVELSYDHELWKPDEAAKGGELELRAFELGTEKSKTQRDTYAGKAATVQVLVMPKAADLAAAVAAAEAAVKKPREDLGLTVKLDPYVDPAGKAMVTQEVGAFKGEARQLAVKINNETSKFAVLAVVNRPQGALVIYCECPPDKRGYWLGEFKAFLATVRPAG